MKKFILLFAIGISISISPARASANVVSDFFNWIVPSELKPTVVVVPTTQPGVGGILITPTPTILSGDTDRTFYLPTLSSRSFRIQNGGTVDLFLNKNKAVNYEASPASVPDDLPLSYSLSVGSDRTIIISNPSTTTNLYLSKTDLGVISAGTSSQPVVFLSNTNARAVPVDGVSTNAPISGFDFSFTFNNATNGDVYVSRLIDPLNLVNLTPIPGATTTVKFIEAKPASIAGDTDSALVIPAGSNRTFDITGIIDNIKGTAGQKILAITGVNYAHTAALTPILTIGGATAIRNLTITIPLGAGALPKVDLQTPTPVVDETPVTTPVTSVTPSTTPTPSTSGTPSPSSTPSPSGTPSPSTTPSPSGTASPSPTSTASPATTKPGTPVTSSPAATPSGTPSATVAATGMVLSNVKTEIGQAIIENEEVVGYPVTFTFTASAVGKTIFFSKDPAVAFIASSTGFGSIVPFLNNITADPVVRTGDGGSYYVITASTSRVFQAFAVIKSDGLTKAGTQIYQIVKINYGTKSTLLTSASVTNPNLKAVVKLAPRSAKPVVTPSTNPTSTASPSPTGSATPSPTSLIALCYAVPTNPYTGDLVTWQVMQTGGNGTPSYTWSGSDGLSGSTGSLGKRYSTSGRKDALVSVVVGSQSVTASCNVNVTLTPTPSYSPIPSETVSPSSSSSASPSPSSSSNNTNTNTNTQTQTSSSPSSSPSGSGVSFTGPARGAVANVLYGMGEWLDSLFWR